MTEEQILKAAAEEIRRRVKDLNQHLADASAKGIEADIKVLEHVALARTTLKLDVVLKVRL